MSAHNFNDVPPARIVQIVMAMQAKSIDGSERNKSFNRNELRAAHKVARALSGGSHERYAIKYTAEEALDEARRFLSLNRRRPCMHRVHGCTELAPPQMRLCALHAEAIQGVL